VCCVRWQEVIPGKKPYEDLLHNAAAFVDLLQSRQIEQQLLQAHDARQQRQQQQQEFSNNSSSSSGIPAAALGGDSAGFDLASCQRTVMLEQTHRVECIYEKRRYRIKGRSDLILEYHTLPSQHHGHDGSACVNNSVDGLRQLHQQQQQLLRSHQQDANASSAAAATGHTVSGPHYAPSLPPTLRHLIELKCPTHPRPGPDPLWWNQALGYCVLAHYNTQLASVVDMAAGKIYTRLVQPPQERRRAPAAATATAADVDRGSVGREGLATPFGPAASSPTGGDAAAAGVDAAASSAVCGFLEPAGISRSARMTAVKNIGLAHGWSEGCIKVLQGLMNGIAGRADREDGLGGGLPVRPQQANNKNKRSKDN
jgi:hypothetical protein